MWVVPLALYLVTFVIVFQTRPVLRHEWMVAVEPLFIVALVGVMVFDIRAYLLWILALNVATFFVITMVCHGELSGSRPPAQHLTAFYMWMSAGGVIGGIFAGLIAPNIFSAVVEYPALVVLAILCRPGLEMPTDTRTRLLWLGAVAVVAVVAFPGLTERYVTDQTAFNWTIGAMLVVAGLVSREPLPFAAVIAVVFIIGTAYRPDSDVRETMRSFFGVHKITETSDGRFRVFLHGTTIHGAERLRDNEGDPITDRPPQITYYHANSPMGTTVRALRQRIGGPIRVAVVGLGTGTFACFAEAGDSFKFYEIDASVEKLARDPSRFSYIARCAAGRPGGARRRAPDARRDVGPVRPDRPRRVLLRRDPDSSDDARGDGDLCFQARAARHRADARVEPAHGAVVRGRRHRARQRAREPDEQSCGARRRGRHQVPFHLDGGDQRARRGRFRYAARGCRLERDRAAGRTAHLDRRLLQRGRRDLAPVSQTLCASRRAPTDPGRSGGAARTGRPADRRRNLRRKTREDAMPLERFEFPNARGEKLAALLDRPAGPPVAFALFAHCFTCGKDVLAAKRIAEGLTARGIAVLRFDFTGLGASEGEFANTTFSSNVADLVAAADHLRKKYQAPAILIGHSLGGAAVLAAAQQIPEARAVATIAAPADPAHVTGLFGQHVDDIKEKGEVEVALAGRPFRIRKEFLDDIAEQKLADCLAGPAQGAAGAARADRRPRRHRERERDLHRREASEELRLARRRRPPAEPARRRRLCGRGDRRLVGALSRHGARAGRDADRGRAGRRDGAMASSSSRSSRVRTAIWPTSRSPPAATAADRARTNI